MKWQYAWRESLLHGLDSRIKGLSLLGFMALIFYTQTIGGSLLLLCSLGIAMNRAQLSWRDLWHGLRPILLLLFLTAILQILFTKQGTVVVQWGWIQVTQEGIHHAVFFFSRLVLVTVLFSLFLSITSPLELTHALEWMLHPLSKLGIPITDGVTMMSISLRFIPILGMEAERLKKAQQARGAVFSDGLWVKRIVAYGKLVIPLIESSFHRAEQLAVAMEARGYQGGYRTRRREMRLSMKDGIFVGMIGLLFWLVHELNNI